MLYPVQRTPRIVHMTDHDRLAPDEARATVLGAGISTDELDGIEADIRITCEHLADKIGYEFTDDDLDTVVNELADELCVKLVEFTTVLQDGRSIRDHFDRVVDDYSDPTSSHARSNTCLFVGTLSVHDDTPDAVISFGNAILRDHYDAATTKSTTSHD